MDDNIKISNTEIAVVLASILTICTVIGAIMSTSHSNRGMSLEKTIERLFQHYEQKGIFCHKLEVKQINGDFVKKSPFDFLVYHNKVLYAFDAKNCESDSLSISNLKLHQLKSLYDIESQGGKGFFLIYYNKRKSLNILYASEAKRLIEEGVKAIPYAKERETKLDILGIL